MGSKPTAHDAAPRRRKLFAAAAMLLGFTLSMAMLEVGLRLAPPAWLEQRMGELNAGDSYEIGTDLAWPIVLEGQKFRQYASDSSFRVRHYEYDHVATTDEFGGRTTPYRPRHTDVIPFMGDSFTFGVGVADAETFVALLAAETMRAQGPPPRLLNLGVNGTALHNQLDTLELRHEELGSPQRYTFSLFMGNDLTNIRRHYQRSAVDASSPGGGGRRWLWRANVFVYHHPVLKRLYAIQFLRQKLLAVMNRSTMPRSTGGFMDPVFLAMRKDLPYLEDSLVFLRLELTRLKDISSRLGFEYLFFLIPDVHQIDTSRLTGKAASLGLDLGNLDAEQLTRAISQTLDEFQVPYLDIGPCLSRAVINELYYTQDNHFTAAGHALAAECMRGNGRLNHFLATDRSVAADNAP